MSIRFDISIIWEVSRLVFVAVLCLDWLLGLRFFVSGFGLGGCVPFSFWMDGVVIVEAEVGR